MKKLFVILMLVLLARVPLSEWNKVPDKDEFLHLLGAVFCEQTNCNKARVGVMEIGEEAVFLVDCLDTNKTEM